LRDYSDDPFTVEELSFLLWCTQGVKEVTSRPSTLRTVPSAGARHPFETYLVVNRVEGLQAGLYRFLAIGHQLIALNVGANIADRVVDAFLLPETKRLAETSAIAFFWVADTRRMIWSYGERGYRYIFIEAGHVCQNLYLATEAIGAGAVAVGAVMEEKLNLIFGIDGIEQFVAYAAAAGKKAKSPR
jgi:SagB-type dehydrogenase family enzyme